MWRYFCPKSWIIEQKTEFPAPWTMGLVMPDLMHFYAKNAVERQPRIFMTIGTFIA
jgi:hypothetical protein